MREEGGGGHSVRLHNVNNHENIDFFSHKFCLAVMSMSVCVYLWKQASVCICVYVCVYMRARVCVFVCVCVSVSVSAQDGIVALGKAHTRPAPPLSSLPKVALETVPIFAWLNTDHSRPWRVECRPLPLSTPLSFRRSMLWCSGLSVLRKFLKPLSTSALPSYRPDVISAVLASLSARSFPLTPACPGQ